MFLFSLILFNKPSLFLLSHSTVYTQNCTVICNKVAVEKGALIQASLAGREGKCGSVRQKVQSLEDAGRDDLPEETLAHGPIYTRTKHGPLAFLVIGGKSRMTKGRRTKK